MAVLPHWVGPRDLAAGARSDVTVGLWKVQVLLAIPFEGEKVESTVPEGTCEMGYAAAPSVTI